MPIRRSPLRLLPFPSSSSAARGVDTGEGADIGTGVRIGPDIVLTNHHVVEGAMGADGRLSRPVACIFDRVRATDGYVTPGIRVDVTGIPASSPPSEDDLEPPAENADASKLDYAILKLDRPLGAEPIVNGFTPRGFVSARSRSHGLSPDEAILVLQHPQGEPMKVDIGSITLVGATRLRHSAANTLAGSSGAPLFDARLALVGLHHVGVDWPGLPAPYNQAVPIGLIVADAHRRGVTL